MLVYLNTYFSGLIPAKVLGQEGPETIIRLTATRGAWHRGEVLKVDSRDIVARDRVHRYCGKIVIW